jgi:hypothetical protein
MAADGLLLSLSPSRLPAPTVALPATAHVLHLEMRDPSGQLAEHLSANVAVGAAGQTWLLPLAVGDVPGRWTVRAVDRLGGGSAEATVEVLAHSDESRPAISPAVVKIDAGQQNRGTH